MKARACDEALRARTAGEGATATARAHLERCADCRAEAAALDELMGALRTLGAGERAAEPTVDLLPALRQAWARRPPAPWWRRWWRAGHDHRARRPGAGLAAASLAAAALLALAVARLRAPARPSLSPDGAATLGRTVPAPHEAVPGARPQATPTGRAAALDPTAPSVEDVDPTALLDDLDAAALARVAAALEKGA